MDKTTLPKTLTLTRKRDRFEARQGSQAGMKFGQSQGEARSQKHHLTCDEGPCRHLAVIGACGGQGPYGCGTEGCPVPRRCGVRTRGKGLEQESKLGLGSPEFRGEKKKSSSRITRQGGDSRCRLLGVGNSNSAGFSTLGF